MEEWIEIETNELAAEAAISDSSDSIRYDRALQNQSGNGVVMDDCKVCQKTTVKLQRGAPYLVL